MLPYLNEDLNITPAKRPKRRRAVDDRMPPMVDALDAYDSLRALMGVEARPLREMSLLSCFFGCRRDKSFDHQGGAGGDGQTRHGQTNDLYGSAPKSA